MKKLMNILIVTLGLVLSASVFASNKETTIYFGNGVYNSESQARDAERELRNAYKTTLETQHPNETYHFDIAYNYHAGAVLDLIEVIAQKQNELGGQSFTPLQLMVLASLSELTSRQLFDWPDGLLSAIEEYIAAQTAQMEVTATHYEKYKSPLDAGKRVIVVAHSQGNLFANASLAQLQESYGDSIGLVGVATLAAENYDTETPYVTTHDGLIIHAIKLTYAVLPSNVDNDLSLFLDTRDISNHQFIPSYFADNLPSKAKINIDLGYFAATLLFPDDGGGSGGSISGVVADPVTGEIGKTTAFTATGSNLPNLMAMTLGNVPCIPVLYPEP